MLTTKQRFIYSLAEFEVLQGRNIEHASLETTSAARGLSPGALIHIFRMHPLPVKGSISLILFAIHAIIFPFLAAFIERWLYNTTDLKKRFALQSTDADVGEMAVRVSGLVQRYRKVAAVDHLDLTVYKGQLLGLLGSNGSGKTTTLQAIAGIGRMTAGTVEIADLGRSTTMNSGVGICPQSNVLNMEPQALRLLANVLSGPLGSFDRRTTCQVLVQYQVWHEKRCQYRERDYHSVRSREKAEVFVKKSQWRTEAEIAASNYVCW